jgi:hypothetical protein
MKVYIVTKKWTDWDGWPKGSDQNLGSFLDKDKAAKFIYDETKSPTALEYGYASVPRGRDFDVYLITELDVTE